MPEHDDAAETTCEHGARRVGCALCDFHLGVIAERDAARAEHDLTTEQLRRTQDERDAAVFDVVWLERRVGEAVALLQQALTHHDIQMPPTGRLGWATKSRAFLGEHPEGASDA